jgi:hypothetical protein
MIDLSPFYLTIYNFMLVAEKASLNKPQINNLSGTVLYEKLYVLIYSETFMLLHPSDSSPLSQKLGISFCLPQVKSTLHYHTILSFHFYIIPIYVSASKHFLSTKFSNQLLCNVLYFSRATCLVHINSPQPT